MADAPRQDARCPHCQTRYQLGQERCTSCGAELITPPRPSRRGPLAAVVAVAVIAAGVIAVASASATDNAQRTVKIAVANTGVQAPVPATSAPVPAAAGPTSSPPKTTPVSTTTDANGAPITIAGTTAPLIAEQQAAQKAEAKLRAEARKQAKEAAKATTPATGGTTPKTTPTVTFDDKKKIRVTKVIQYNPNNRVGAVFGDAIAAIDDNVRTVWDVTVPVDHQPVGVGLVLDLGQTKHVHSLKIGTPTPGFGAVVYYADATTLPPQLDNSWTRAKKIKSVNNGMQVDIADTPQWARYVLVWFTNPSVPANPRVAISELELLP